MMPTKSDCQIIKKVLEEHRAAFQATFSEENLRVLEQITECMLKAFRNGNKVLLCGNGGSAADAQHIAAEFIGRFNRERKSLPAIALTTDTSILTAVANDYSYEFVFERQIEGLGVAGDVLIAISTSGNSRNVVLAAKKAKDMMLTTVGFTGNSGGRLKDVVDIHFCVSSTQTPHIQEMHTTALHAVSEAVEDALFPS